MAIEIVRAGVQTTIQDQGRWNYQRYGVPVGGVMDHAAARTANLLVGNDPSCALLEMTAIGATLRFTEHTLVALCGAEMSSTIAGKPLPLNRPVWLASGTTVAVGTAQRGCRAYLAVAGGLDVQRVLGSRSAYVRGGFQRLVGRTLQAGDYLEIGIPSVHSRRLFECLQGQANGAATASLPWQIPARLPSPDDETVDIRVTRGSEFEWLAAASQKALFETEFTITANSDRMGYRLASEGLTSNRDEELLSEGVTPGTVQLPSGGQLILLMADCSTSGGYPKVAHVISVDLPLLAQLPIGRRIRLQEVTIEQAQEQLRSRESAFRRLAVAIELKMLALETP